MTVNIPIQFNMMLEIQFKTVQPAIVLYTDLN